MAASTSPTDPFTPAVRDLIREEASRIAASPGFANSDQLKRFLTLAVERTLDGRAQELKESVIGVEVFDRQLGYDPKVDAIVRVQARRLRAKLDEYYAHAGSADPVLIEIPKGSYVPSFSFRSFPAAPETLPAVPEPVRAQRTRWSVWALLPVVAALSIASYAWFRDAERPAGLQYDSRPLTSLPGYERTPALSPDGNVVAFGWDYALYVQNVTADVPRKITEGDAAVTRPVWSPDGRQVAFLRRGDDNMLSIFTIPVPGGAERKLTGINALWNDDPALDWSPDGEWLATAEMKQRVGPLGIVLIHLRTGAKRILTVPPGNSSDTKPKFSPDGTTIAFRRTFTEGVTEVLVVPFSGGASRAVTSDRRNTSGHAWLRDGKSLIVGTQRAGGGFSLWSFPVDGGRPVRLTPGGISTWEPATARNSDLIVYALRFLDTDLYQASVGGAVRKVADSTMLDSSPNESPDGRQIAFRSERAGNSEIWVANSDGSGARRLTFDSLTVTGSPNWSPDGRQIAFDSRPNGHGDIYVAPLDGGSARKITNAPSNEVVPSWSNDGSHIYFGSDRTGSWEVWKQPLGAGAAVRVTHAGGFAPRESPDGRWLYYSKGFRIPGVFRMPVNGGPEEVVLPDLEGNMWGCWSISDRGLYFLPAYARTSVHLLNLRTRAVTDTGIAVKQAAVGDGNLHSSRDGSRIYFNQVERLGSDIHVLEPASSFGARKGR